MSCEKDDNDYIPPEPPETSIEEYINHYSTISTPSYVWEGTEYRERPFRWKDGGLKGTDSIDVFFHESFSNTTAKNELITFLSVLDNIIEDENIKFNVVDSIEDADITIVFGPDNYEDIYNNEPNYDWLGQATWRPESDTEYDIVDSDITKIVEGSFWVSVYDDLLIKHEFLHVLGFAHTNKYNSLMNHYVGNMANLKDIDEKAIYLKYDNNLSEKIIDNDWMSNGTSPPFLFTQYEYEIHLDNVKIALENRFDL